MATWEEYKKTIAGECDIFEAARMGDAPSLYEFLQNGGDVNLKNHNGHSLLMLAAYNGSEEACRILIQAGADVNAQDKTGNSILMGVSFKGLPHIASLLLKAGANVKLKNGFGLTALGFAKTFGRQDVVDVLRDSVSP